MTTKDSLTTTYSNPLVTRHPLISILVIVLFYFLLVKLSLFITVNNELVCPVYLASGLSLASVLIIGNRALIGVFIGSALTNFFLSAAINNPEEANFTYQLAASCMLGIGNSIASYITASILNRLCQKQKGHLLSNGKNALLLLFVGSICFSTITGFIGILSLNITHFVPTQNIFYTYKLWWLGDIIGIILITPFLLALFLKDAFDLKKYKFLELSLHALTIILVCVTVFFRYTELKYLILPVLFWSSYRFTIQITTFVLVVVSLFSIFTTIQGIGPFNEEYSTDSILFLDLFLIVICICTLFLAGIITERNKAEELIKVSESTLRQNQTLLYSALESPKNFSIYSIGLNYEYLSFNSQHYENMKTLFGAEIALGKKMQDCNIIQSELETAIKTLDKVFTGESITIVRYFEIDDSYWEFNTSPIISKDDGIIGATVISSNITKKVKNEEALKKSEEKYREIFENVQDVIFQTDINGNFIELSPSIKDFSGYTAEELIGKSTHFLLPDNQKDQSVIDLINEKLILNFYEKQIKTKSGDIKDISLNAKIIFDTHGNKHHINALVRDITQRKKNEKEIALQNQKLQIQNKELEQFAYITSHDLQEPLISLKYFSELIKTEIPKESNSDLIQYLNFIWDSSDRMQKMVKGLLDYSRIGNQSNIENIDCNVLLEKVLDSLSETIKITNSQITIENLPQLNGYYVELVTLFEHLIVNAITFRNKNLSPIITIKAQKNEVNWLFTIEDNGIGIEEQNIEKAFVIFKRLHNREDYPGTGIGLAICKKIIALHGGKIWIESRIGSGTVVHFTIPILQ